MFEALGAAFHEEISLAHRFAGGASPVAKRQTLVAAWREARAIPAARPAYRPDQSSLRNIVGCLASLPFTET
jgi:hypothetical protein